MKIGSLRYIYIGSKNTDSDLRFFQEKLKAQLLWKFQKFGAEVGAVSLTGASDIPILIFADHKPPGYMLPIFICDNIDDFQKHFPTSYTVETPDGPCLIVTDESGNHFGFLRQDRPGILEDTFRSSKNLADSTE